MRKSPPRALLRLEALEDRCTPTTFTVNTLNDTPDDDLNDPRAWDASEKTSLRAAIQQANHTPGADTINFEASLSGTIALQIAMDSISSGITIVGPGSDVLTVTRSASAATNFRIFRIMESGAATIYDLSITGGISTTDGGGIYNEGYLWLQDCEVFGNTATNRGGGIFNLGDMDISGSHVYWNDAEDGGGIYNAWDLSVFTDTDIYANDATHDGGGICNSGSLTSWGDIYGNYAGRNGGGLYSSGDEVSVQFWGGTLESNTAVQKGGGAYVSGSATFDSVSITTNAADKGGGAYVTAGTVTFINTDIVDNTATTLGPGICYAVGATVSETGGNRPQGTVPDN